MFDDARNHATRTTEIWLRHHGLPYFVPGRRRGTLLVPRTIPFVALLICLDLVAALLNTSRVTVVEVSPLQGVLLVFCTAVALVFTTAAPVTAWLLGSALMRRFPRSAWYTGSLLIAGYVAGAPWLSRQNGDDLFSSGGVVVRLLMVAAGLLVTWAGVGSVLSWAIRSSFHQLRALGQIVTKAVPLLMLVVVFAFFAKALWEVTGALSVLRVVGIVAFFCTLGLIFITPIIRSEMIGLDEQIDPDERSALLSRAKAGRIPGRDTAPGPPLGHLERLNVVAIMVLAQGIQMIVVAVLVGAFLVILGELALPPATLSSWLGRPPEVIVLLGLPLGLDVAMVKTAIILSSISALNFVVSATSGAAYRSAFYDPLVRQARAALAVRSSYDDVQRTETSPAASQQRR
ncbi:hypothetical protein KPL76_05420 [Subtercola sp. PAMC28395]|uniref:hypothetical protein n=1 Tax=Subtercola sp. PAMC28395 TaxID=2846775 RepID=UPI001C0B0E5C|nr:hypothetical protein [Subtercola sp. PAMC28395]QWT24803.1 hypothetical protein KPL76_05420 [Subtercola sp. PAMC28395]